MKFIIYSNFRRLFFINIHSSPSLYKSLAVIILPSFIERLSKSLIEAGSMIFPIITALVPGCKDLLVNNYSR